MTKFNRRRLCVLLAATAAIAALGLTAAVARDSSASTEPQPRALLRSQTAADRLPAAVRIAAERQGFDVRSVRRIGSDMFLVRAPKGLICTMDTSGGGMAGTCSKEQGFFNGGSAVFAVVSSGPSGTLTDTKVVGIVRDDVSVVTIRSGTTDRTARPTTDGGFMLDISGLAVADGRALSFQTLDPDGRVLDSYSLPTT
jgi:hypothetical protein